MKIFGIGTSTERRASDVGRRSPRFRERLSMFMAVCSAMGAAYVLIDPMFTITLASGVVINIGGEGFSPQLKGTVVGLILVGGWTSIIAYWLGQSATGQTQSESMSRIAEGSPAPGGASIAADIKSTAVSTSEIATNTEKQP